MRRRLSVAITLVAAASVVLFALPLGVLAGRNYRDQELLRLQRDAVAATRQLDLEGPNADPIELPGSADAVAAYDITGALRAGDGPSRADATVAVALRSRRPEVSHPDGTLVAAAPIITGERVTGALRIARADTVVTRRTRRTWLALAGLAGALVIASALVAVAIARRLSRPLERVAVAATRLGEGDFSGRVAPAGVGELDAVGAALNATAQRLEGLVAREREFSANASHQLRTPLAALRIELEAIGLGDRPPPELAPALAQVDRLQATVDTLLALARDDPRDRGVVDLAPVLAEARREWHGRFAAAGRPLRIDFPSGKVVAGSSERVTLEILTVLLANAFEHGAGTVTLTVREAERGWVAIDVADEGAGVGDVDVFARRSPGASGHGIGLSLARSLATAEGGSLIVTRAGPGPVFTLLLPTSPSRERPDHERTGESEHDDRDGR